MNEVLHQAYLNTNYSAFITPEQTINIRINSGHPNLDIILEAYQAESWIFLTAWNPSSKLLSRAENQKRNQNLEVFLKEKAFFAGRGVAENGNWEEESYLILDIKLEAAKALGQRFTQNAILFGKIKEQAQLIYL